MAMTVEKIQQALHRNRPGNTDTISTGKKPYGRQLARECITVMVGGKPVTIWLNAYINP